MLHFQTSTREYWICNRVQLLYSRLRVLRLLVTAIDTSTVQIYRKMSIHEFVQYDHTYNFTKQAQSQKNTISKQQVKRPSLQNHLFVVRMK